MTSFNLKPLLFLNTNDQPSLDFTHKKKRRDRKDRKDRRESRDRRGRKDKIHRIERNSLHGSCHIARDL